MNQNTLAALQTMLRQYDSISTIRTEIIDYCTYLSASDGEISGEEADFFTNYLATPMSPEQISHYIAHNGTYSDAFEQKVPATLVLLVRKDKDKILLITQSNSEEIIVSDALSFVELFEMLGREFISCDGEPCQQELDDLHTYTSMLRKYVNSELGNTDGMISTLQAEAMRIAEMEKLVGKKPTETLEELLDELEGLTGLDDVKKSVSSLIHLQSVKFLRKSRGFKEVPISNHLVFYGNPGTGKTTIARLIAKIYHKMGILSEGQFIEVDRAGLVGGYVGQTALKTKQVIDKAIGGVLFIDEAYGLTHNGSDNDYGREALDIIIKAMEDYRENLIIIVAGYPELMTQFIESNPGLKSRFNKYIYFRDYTPDELIAIFNYMCEKSDYRISDAASEYVNQYLQDKYDNKDENFANGREVRNFFERSLLRQADRIYTLPDPSDAQLCTLELEDVQEDDVYVM